MPAAELGLLPGPLIERAASPATVAKGHLRRWGQGPGHLPRCAKLWEACWNQHRDPGACIFSIRLVPAPGLNSGSNPEVSVPSFWAGALWRAMQTPHLVPCQPVTLARSPSLNLFLLYKMGSWYLARFVTQVIRTACGVSGGGKGWLLPGTSCPLLRRHSDEDVLILAQGSHYSRADPGGLSELLSPPRVLASCWPQTLWSWGLP